MLELKNVEFSQYARTTEILHRAITISNATMTAVGVRRSHHDFQEASHSTDNDQEFPHEKFELLWNHL